MTTSFDALGVSVPVQNALKARGILAPFEIQAKVIPDGLADRDILARSETGSGKTLGFAIPIVELLDRNSPRPAALVLVPTRELAIQVAEDLRPLAASKHMKVALAYGGTSINKQASACRDAHIIVATPGRLEDLCQRGAVHLDQIETLVLDEADHMLDLGFQPQVDRLVKRIPNDRQTMLFSATLDGEVGRMAERYTHNPVRHEVVSETKTNGRITHRFIPVAHARKTDALIDLLDEDTSLTLVFVRTKHGAARLAKKLDSLGIDAVAMHGDMGQRQRERALQAFSTGRASALVATDVAARGIDVEHIMRVINFDAPNDDKSFVHRVGRTGRAGRDGTAITFVSPEQARDVGQMANRLDLSNEFAVEHPHVGLTGKGGQRPQGSRGGSRGSRNGSRGGSRGGYRSGSGGGGGYRSSSGGSSSARGGKGRSAARAGKRKSRV